MEVDDTLASVAAKGPEAADEQDVAAWWQTRSTEELRAILSRGFGMGAAFEAATAETERRARERLKLDEEAAAVEAERKKRLRLQILGGVLLACLLVLGVMLLRG